MPQARTIQASRIARDEVVLVGPPDGEDAVDDLSGLPLVVRERGSGTRSAVAHLIPARPSGIEVGSSEAARRCVLEGLGYSLISRLAVAEDLAAGRMKVVNLPGAPVERSFFVARRAQATPTAAARVLWRVLLSESSELA
jgi:DNA-binding transcriptional LysR family regulator